MARIDQYVAQVGLQAPPMPNTAIDNPMPRALQGLGNSIQDVGGVFEDLQARNDKRSGFAADNAYRKFQVDLDEGLTETQASVPEDGRGLLDSFKSNVYRQKRDAFLQQLDPKQRQRYELLTDPEKGSDAAEWFSKAANAERDMTYKNAESVWSDTSQQLATGIDQDPDNFEAYRQAGLAEIERTPLPAAIREARKKEWNNFAEVAYYNRLAEQNPSRVFRELGADWSKLTPVAKFDLLTTALEQQETGGEQNPDAAISPAGAIGRRQVMPGTAREIAKELGDGFVARMDPVELTRYLQTPSVNKRYSDYYLHKQLNAFGGDVESALIAYNAGPGVAQKWIASGKNDAMLPNETRKYKRDILTKMGGGATEPYQVDVSATRNNDGLWYAPGVKYDLAGKVRDKPVSQDYVARVSGTLPRIGDGVGVRIVSAGQEATGLARIGSHRHDVDATGHSNTSDFILTQNGKPVTPKQAPELYAKAIEEFAAAGFTGIGHYPWGLHVGDGKPAFWGPDTTGKTADGRFSIAYERGREKVNMAMAAPQSGTRPSALDYKQRQTIISNAEQSYAKVALNQRASIETTMVNAPIAVQNTGQYAGDLPSAEQFAVAYGPVEGAQKYTQFLTSMEVGQQAYDYRTMSTAAIMADVAANKPTSSGDDAALEAKRYETLTDAANATLKAREADPVTYTMQTFPNVAKAWADAAQTGDYQSALSQSYTAQQQLGIKDMKLLPEQIATDAAKKFNDDTLPDARARVEDAARLLFSTNDPAQQKIIFDQLAAAGLPETSAGAFTAAQRGDYAAAQRLFQAVMIDPSTLPGKPPFKPAEIDQTIQDNIMADNQVGDVYYGLSDGSTQNFNVAQRDAKLMQNAINLRVRKGETLEDAAAGVAKDMYGDVQVVTGTNAKVLIPADQSPDAFLSGFEGLLPRVRAELEKTFVPPADVQGSDNAIVAATKANRINDLVDNGYFRNSGDGYVFMDPYSGLAVADAAGNPIVFTDADVLAAVPAARPRNVPDTSLPAFQQPLGAVEPSAAPGGFLAPPGVAQ